MEAGAKNTGLLLLVFAGSSFLASSFFGGDFAFLGESSSSAWPNLNGLDAAKVGPVYFCWGGASFKSSFGVG